MHRTRRAPGRRTLASLAIGALLASAAAVGISAPAAAAEGPSIVAVDAPREGGEMTITGSGFAGVYPGIYIGIGVSGLPGFYIGSGQMSAMALVGPQYTEVAEIEAGLTVPMTTDGRFSVTLPVPAFSDSQSYSVYTSKAHGEGFADPSQNSITPIQYAAPPVVEPEPEPEPAPAVATTTTVAASPSSPIASGQQTTITATVAATGGATPTGDVVFAATPAAGDVIPLGTGTLSGGKATWTGSLPAGGHYLSAAYQGAIGAGASFSASNAQLMAPAARPGGTATIANYSVVDTAEPVPYTVAEAVTTVADVSAEWAYSAYSAAWAKTATGGITVDDQSFSLTGGTAVADAGGVVVDFTGTLRVAAYTTLAPYAPAGAWVELVDPSIAITADGTGTWSAGIRTGETTDNAATPARTVVSTFRGASLPDLTVDGSTSVTFDYADTTASGTWSRGHDDAWSNAFIMQVPASIRAFYYASGANADANKPASPLALAWGAAEVPPVDPGTDEPGTEEPGTEEPVPTEDGNLAWAFIESWNSYVTSIASGTISLGDGATRAEDGRFVFPQADGSDADAETGIGTIRYRGSVLFSSTAHGFDYGFADPWIITEADGSRVLSALSSTSDQTGLGETRRVVLAVLEPLDAQPEIAAFARIAAVAPGLSYANVPTTITDQLPASLAARYAGDPGAPVSYGYNVAVVDPGAEQPTAPVPPSNPVPADNGTTPVTTPTGDEAAEETCTARAVGGASISWSVRDSFRQYIEGPIAKGSYSINWGAGDGAYNTEDDRGRVSYAGSASFTGHGGALDMNLSNPRIQVTSATTASLILDVRSAGYGDSVAVNAGGVTFATLRLPAATETADRISWSGASTTLTAAGAEAFGGFYKAGEALDAVSFSLPLGADVACDSTTSTTLARTGSEQGAETFWIGFGLLLLGAGAFALRRRTARV